MQMARYSVKLSYLSSHSQSPISNFTLFTLLFTSLFHFFPPFFFINPLSSISQCTFSPQSMAPPVPLFPPSSCLSLRSTCGNEFSPWQWAAYPQERQQSLTKGKQIYFLISPPASGCDTLNRDTFIAMSNTCSALAEGKELRAKKCFKLGTHTM